MAKKAEYTPIQTFANVIQSIEKLESALSKMYSKLEKSAYTQELKQCLSPTHTDGAQHMIRLKLIKTAIKTKASPAEFKPNPANRKFASATPQQDVEIIFEALKRQHEKLAYYGMIHPMASALKLEQVATLIEQTIIDNKNTNAWLQQIMQNIVLPELLSSQETKVS